MPRRLVIDAGPLVALLDATDEHHSRAVSFSRRFAGAAITTVAAATEVMHLLGNLAPQQGFLALVLRGTISIEELQPGDWNRVAELTAKYSDLPMDFADATIVAIAERLNIRDVATLDDDFAVYRFRDRWAFRNLF